MNILDKIPVARTLQVSTRKSRESARTELFWNIGFAFVPVVIVAMVVVLSLPLAEAPAQVLSTIGRGELMVYAASVCGAVLYTLRYNLNGPLPEVVKQRTTPIGTLTGLTGLCMFVAVGSYLVRRMSDIHHTPLNVSLITWASIVVLLVSVLIAYVVLALKHALAGGASDVSRESDDAFADKWARSKEDA